MIDTTLNIPGVVDAGASAGGDGVPHVGFSQADRGFAYAKALVVDTIATKRSIPLVHTHIPEGRTVGRASEEVTVGGQVDIPLRNSTVR
jgi:hypothetical protein